MQTQTTEQFDVVVIGAGQSGLAVGYYLAQRGLRFVIVDGAERVGDQWRRRWDSLRLFTPARYDALPGLRFPAPPSSFPTKDQMADYLEAYAAHFALPVRTQIRVEKISREDGRYIVDAGSRRFEAEHVVVATSSFRQPRVPAFASELGPEVVHLHSSAYRNASQLKPGPVLVVGAGNSGAEISLELAKLGRETWMAGRATGHVPFRIDGFWSKVLLVHVVLRLVFHRLLTLKTPLGRKASRGEHGGPLIRVKPADLHAAGVRRLPRIEGVGDGVPMLADGRKLDVANVIWCTGFEPGFSWIDLPIFGARGRPIHDAGVVSGQPGFYFIGLPFLFAMSSVMIHGVGRDAKRIVETIATRCRESAERTAAGKTEGPASKRNVAFG